MLRVFGEGQILMKKPRAPIIVAHKVNRPALLRRYLSIGVPFLEIDVNLNGDCLVVQHGADFSNFGAVRGEIMKLGYILMEHRDPLWKPLLLEDYLSMVGGRTGLWLDIKCKNVERDIIGLVRKHDVKPIVVSSAYHEALKAIKEMEPSVTTILGNVMFRPVDPVGMVRAAKADGISVERRYIDRELVETVHSAGLQVAAWTVNDTEKARELIGMGCDYIITDVPEKILRLVRELKGAQAARLP